MGSLAKNTVLLTASSIVMRCVGLMYQVWLAGRIGSAGIGLFQLIGTVNVLCVTLAVSGIRFATTRLVSEEIGLGCTGSIGSAAGRCVSYASVFGVMAFAVLFFGAERIGFLWIGDARTVLSLRIISLSMPMLAISSVLSGYFIATGKVLQAAVIQILEQLINIACAVAFLSAVSGGDLEQSCAAIAKSNVIADSCSLFMATAVYFKSRQRGNRACEERQLTPRMLRIALPLAFSAYARTSLTTLMNLLVPRKLRVSGLSAEAALSGYGIITGMVYPIITFPSCLLSAAAEISISELTAAQMKADKERIRHLVLSLLGAAALFSAVVAMALFAFAGELGMRIYKSPEAARYIRLFALIVPIMYMDIVTDGCLKGLGQMMNSMAYNISEALLGLVFVILLIPKWGLAGYIFVLFFCEVFNFCLSMNRLRKVCGVRKRRRAGVVKPYETQTIAGSFGKRKTETQSSIQYL